MYEMLLFAKDVVQWISLEFLQVSWPTLEMLGNRHDEQGIFLNEIWLPDSIAIVIRLVNAVDMVFSLQRFTDYSVFQLKYF